MGSFSVTTRKGDGDVPILAVEGELDIYTAPEFQQQLLRLADLESEGLVVDLGRSTFLDASACRALLRAARRLGDHGAQLVVINRDAEVARIFDVMGLDEFLTVVGSREAARQVLAAV